ncbi:MAG: Gfo/Idh/MocA family oxidoreductase [Chloroflexota bacterium]|nr:Gfo/Idh/MocA family oxidoreductase [Chloroflexota bacterium]
MDRARIGIIGVGWWGTVGHLEPLSSDDKADIVAVFSRTEAKARDRAERYGVPRYYTDYRALIDECNLDGVIIATTPNVHYEQARYALEHDVHVLMEKPFVLQARHAEELARLAEERDLLLSVCHPVLFHPWMQEARRRLRKNVLGDILMISALFSQRVYDLYRGDVSAAFDDRAGGYPRPNRTSYSDPSIVGGGEGHTQASHLIGSVLWLTELRPVSVYAQMNSLDVEVDVVDAILVRFDNGALCTLTTNGLLPRGVSSNHIQIQGEKGIFAMDTLNGSALLHLDAEEGPQAFDTPPRFDTREGPPRNFVRAILGEETLHADTQVAIDEVRILDAAYRSAESGESIQI